MIAIDWGTSSLRAYRLGVDGAVRERRESADGILAVKDGGFGARLSARIGDWLEADRGATVVMSGMIGSRQGWHEAAYVATPAGPDEIAAALAAVSLPDGRTGWIVPGILTRDAAGVHDVMRGEETQILGVLDDLGPGRHVLCMPGTHSKWVTVDDGRITAFATHMTGEVFAVLRDHSLLGRMMATDAAFDAEAFDAGVDRARDAGGLLHHLFSGRAQVLAGALAAAQTRDYLSGMLLAHECLAAPACPVTHLLGARTLCERYARVLERLGRSHNPLDPDAVVPGLLRIAAARGMLPGARA